MRLHRRDGRRGIAIILVVVMLFALISLLLAVSPFRWGASWDVAADQLSLETLNVAESISDEISMRLAQDANDPDKPLFQALRRGISAPGLLLQKPHTPSISWKLPPSIASEYLSLGKLPNSTAFIVSLGGGAGVPRFKMTALSLQFFVTDRWCLECSQIYPPFDLKAQFLIQITVTGESPKRSLSREVTRRQGLRITRLALPYPFDSHALFAFNSARAIDRENARDVGFGFHEAARTLLDTIGSFLAIIPSGNQVRARIEEVENLFAEPDDFGVHAVIGGRRQTRKNNAIYTKEDQDAIPDLDQWRLGTQAQAHADELDRTRQELIRIFQAIGSGDGSVADGLEPALDGFTTAAAAYRETIQKYIVQTNIFLPRNMIASSAFGPAIDYLQNFSRWERTAWYRLEDLNDFETMFGPERAAGLPVARNGVVSLKGSGPALLDSRSVWGPSAGSGRLFIVTDRPIQISDLVTPTTSLVTVVTTGHVTLARRVDACIVALGGLSIRSSARIHGSLVFLGGDIEIEPGAQLTLDPNIHVGSEAGKPRPPLDVLWHVALDPYQETIEIH